MPAFARHPVEDVKPDWKVRITRIEIHHIISSPRRNVIKEIVRQVPVRIDYPDALPIHDILKNQIPQKRCFPRTGLSEHIRVVTPVASPKTARLLPTRPGVAHSDWVDFVVVHSSKQASTPREKKSPFGAVWCFSPQVCCQERMS